MGEIEKPIFRDIRRYFCEYCGICRSKKSLITSHILTHHKEVMEEKGVDEEEKIEGTKSNTCTECGATFKKLAYLKQHMQSHSLERPYTCPVDDCHSSYRRNDHLTRHLLLHQGKLFNCPIENCNREFSFHGNMKRHVKEFHGEDQPLTDAKCQKQYVCPEIGCGKAFRFASKLRKHEDSHVKLDSVEAFCCEPGCMKYFSNDQCLKAHIKSCHQHITCEICGTKQVKRNIKRHLQMHEAKVSLVRIKCNHKGCFHTFSNKSNLRQHEKAVHLDLKPFACSFTGCGVRFAYKHVRDNHEKTRNHVYSPPLVDQKSSRRVASRFQKIQALHLRRFHQIMENEQVQTSQNVSILNQMKEFIDGTEEETVETCNGKIFLNCVLDDSQNLSDYDDLADFIECKQGKDYNGWLKDRQRYRNWRSQKMAVLRWKKKIKTLKLIRKK